LVALVLVAVPLALAVVPVAAARRSRSLFATDIGLVILPAVAFVVSVGTFNEAAQIGWALIIYPFLIVWLSVAALYVRVFFLPRVGVRPSVGATGTLLLAIAAASAFGAMVAPWYE
jgi:hypothetical protein